LHTEYQAGLDLGVFDKLAVILDAFVAGFVAFLPLGMVAPDQIEKILLCLDMGYSHEIIYLAVTDLAFIFHRSPLFDAIFAPAAGRLAAVVPDSAKTDRISL